MAPDYGRDRGLSSAEIFRRYVEIAREELGPKTFLLTCWGVLPEVTGLADGCRLGGDGYGPATMQQYNSWNGVVWRNDPDHCDILPKQKGVDGGNVTQLTTARSSTADSHLRPALASLAGAMLLLSDRAEVYREDAVIEGAKRCGPRPFHGSGPAL